MGRGGQTIIVRMRFKQWVARNRLESRQVRIMLSGMIRDDSRARSGTPNSGIPIEPEHGIFTKSAVVEIHP